MSARHRSRRSGARRQESVGPATHTVQLQVNTESVTVDVRPGDTVLQVLRGLRLSGTKLSCGRGECGACTVLVGGRPVVACMTLAVRVDEPVTTVEGLADEFGALRTFFARCAGFQCGFCTPGQIVTAAAVVRSGEVDNEEGVREGMSGNLCRCTGYGGIIEAVTASLRPHGSEPSGSDDGVPA